MYVTGAYRGKYEKKVLGEKYIDMISGWYRQGEYLVCSGQAKL